jgi:hypothetical protein
MNNIRQQIHELPPLARENIIITAIIPGLRAGLDYGLSEAEIKDWLLDIIEDAHTHIRHVREKTTISRPAAQPDPAPLYCITRRLTDAPEDTKNRLLHTVIGSEMTRWGIRDDAFITSDLSVASMLAMKVNGVVAKWTQPQTQEAA